MQSLFDVRKKPQAVLALFTIVVLILLTNFSSRRDYADLNRTISSIYQDRLMPANYLFKISDHLYQKKILQQSAAGSGVLPAESLAAHNHAIDGLIKHYEETYLTPAEKEQWGFFKQELNRYNQAEAALVQAIRAGQPATLQPVLHTSFDRAVSTLNKLSDIQAAEGKLLQRHSQSVIGGSLLQSYLEVALLFILCILILGMIGISGKHQLLKQRHLLN